MTGLIILAELKHQLKDLNKVKKIVKVLGMVNAASDFDKHPKVINGFSDLMIEVFGDKGKHARSAVGVCSLPFNMAVEIEVIVEIENRIFIKFLNHFHPSVSPSRFNVLTECIAIS